MNIFRRVDSERLLALAANRSRAARTELSASVIDLFLPAEDRLTDQQRALMNDVLGKLIGGVEVEMRQHLIDALLRSRMEMPDLEALLANDRLEVARPILERSSVIRDLDLISVVMQRAEEHRMALALRQEFAAPPALERHSRPAQDQDILEQLLANPDSIIARRAMEYLVAESKRYDQFQEPLLTRNDLPADMAYRLYWWVSAAMRTYILNQYRMEAAELDPLIQMAARRGLATHEEGHTAQARALRLAARMLELGELTDDFLLQSLRQARLTLFTASLSARAGVAFMTAWKIITDRSYESFIVLNRAMDVNREIAASLVLIMDGLQSRSRNRPMTMLNDLLRLYDELECERAAKVLRFWQMDSHFQEAVEDMQPAAAILPSV